MRALKLLCSALLISLPAAALADSFAVRLGKTTLGSLTLNGTPAAQSLNATLGNTPMGVFNGTFDGRSTKDSAGAQTFVGISNSSRKSRNVTVVIKDGAAQQTTIEPASELTALSDISLVPSGVIDPVQAVAALARAATCPGRIVIYDGRRVIALSPSGQEAEGGTLTCRMDYAVIAGPGHLSPLKIRKAKMALTYAGTGSAARLARIQIGSGVFTLTLDRQD